MCVSSPPGTPETHLPTNYMINTHDQVCPPPGTQSPAAPCQSFWEQVRPTKHVPRHPLLATSLPDQGADDGQRALPVLGKLLACVRACMQACMHAFSEYLLSSSSPPGSLWMLGQRAPTAKPCPTEPASRGHETRARAHNLAPSLTSCVTADLSQDLSKPRQGDEWAEKPACLHGCNED